MIICPAPDFYESKIRHCETPDQPPMSFITLPAAVAKFNRRGTIKSLQKAASDASKAEKQKEKMAKLGKKRRSKRKAAEVEVEQIEVEVPALKRVTRKSARK
jgi:hypothetical protein